MAKSKNFKVKSTKKAAPKVETNEGTYVDTAVTNTKSGGKGGNGAGYSSSNVQAPADPISAIYDTPAKNPGKMAISELPGQYTKPIPVPKKSKK
jgi:hypothetical protein